MKRQITMRYAAGDILAVVKENCDKVSAATHGAETLWSIDYTFRKKKKFLMVSTTDKAQTAIFRIMAIKKNAYVIDTGLAGYPPAVCRTAIEKITRKIKGNEDF